MCPEAVFFPADLMSVQILMPGTALPVSGPFVPAVGNRACGHSLTTVHQRLHEIGIQIPLWRGVTVQAQLLFQYLQDFPSTGSSKPN